jgi:hypothetical protein
MNHKKGLYLINIFIISVSIKGRHKMTHDETMKLMDIITDIIKPPFQLLEHELQGICSFSMAHYPTEIPTEDDPPVKLGERTEIIPIDKFLGLYSPDKREILIFLKGIREASDILQVNPKHLETIVRIHEWAHAILHLGVTEKDRVQILKDDSYWAVVLESSTGLFKEIEPALHEMLAQILTLYCVQDMKRDSKSDQGRQVLERLEQTFHHLSLRQPPEYHIQDLLGVPRDRICKSIGLIRNRCLVGQAEPWKTVIKW